MKKTSTIILIAVIGMLTLQIFPSTVRGLTTVNTRADLFKYIPSSLDYGIPNSTSLLYKTTQNMMMNTTIGTPDYEEGSNIDYSLMIASTINKTADTNTLVVQKYHNNTNTISPYIDMSEFNFDSEDANVINNSLINLIQGQFIYPKDITPEILMGNDSSFYIAELYATGGFGGIGMYAIFLDMIATNQTLINSGNITVNQYINTTTITTTGSEVYGCYTYNVIANISISSLQMDDGGDPPMTDMNIFANMSFIANITFNRYHTVDTAVLGMKAFLGIVSTVNPSQHGELNASAGIDAKLLTSSLPPFPETPAVSNFLADNWIWFVTIGVGAVAVALLVIFFVQRSNCGNLVDPTKSFVCRMSYKPKPAQKEPKL